MTSPVARNNMTGVVIGDPAGVGPEVVVKALCAGGLAPDTRHLLIGSASVISRALETCGLDASIKTVAHAGEVEDTVGVLHVLDPEGLPAEAFPLGADSAAAGDAVANWMDIAIGLAREGTIDALVMAPISSGSFKLAGQRSRTVSPVVGESYLLIFSGALRVAHLTDHVPLASVSGLITADQVKKALVQLDAAMRSWGMEPRRIGVSGFNAHANGPEDREQIAPGVERARALGVDASLPQSPDAVFRHCIEGRYDMVLAMYHDQGHIAVKTWGFSGNCVLVLGPPYLFLSVAHGTAYDIVGTGKSDPAMLHCALKTASLLARGQGIGAE
ncbi:4-hydroxythreonine-4-phosphate dehydrogenase PdxA [Sphingobium sp. TB-6]|uniref:PdxA family dehydrogenase n=1 Tax=Sphingobium sp. TB-6 TaxID=2728850 RepID=UPI00146AF4B2|nr:4-hydroxythreonine-4-phosphate dehydrogenase PdxA [Sphingobium sp. TB-6]NML91855.1 4-hydroxythreonine-4-phosphate dehydrogenase PdxA [Sphingobium sp. TB-6]